MKKTEPLKAGNKTPVKRDLRKIRFIKNSRNEVRIHTSTATVTVMYSTIAGRDLGNALAKMYSQCVLDTVAEDFRRRRFEE